MQDSESHLCSLPDNMSGKEDSEDPAQRFRLGAALSYNLILRELMEA